MGIKCIVAAAFASAMPVSGLAAPDAATSRPDAAVASECHGVTFAGRIDRSVKLPMRGANFIRHSLGPMANERVYVHSLVHELVLAAYEATAKVHPETTFVYGETGLVNGGPIPPHTTHQNGLSVDFFVPVVDANGGTVTYPANGRTRYGYAVEFDGDAKYDGLTIDFVVMAEHLYQLDVAAKARGAGIDQVVFDRAFLPRLFATPRGPYLEKNVYFMRARPWERHDDHYHVDFDMPCKMWEGRSGRVRS